MMALPALLAFAALISPHIAAAAAAVDRPAPASLQYLGHSCFLLTVPSGERIAIDPYASGEWPGLQLPYIHADRVLVTHPHWDHNAWRAVRGRPRLTEETGVTRGKDYVITGIAGRHAETGGASIDWRNTVFVIETAGLRLCHAGDNGPITPELKARIGDVDILMLPVDAEKRVLTYEQARDWIQALSPRIVVPMHYRLPGLALDQIRGIGAIDEWLSQQPGATRLASDTLVLDPAALPPRGARQIMALTVRGEKPAEAGAPLPPGAAAPEARKARRRAEIAAAEGDMVTALAEYERASALDPSDAESLEKVGFLQLSVARPDRALEFFRKALAAGTAVPKTASLAWLGSGMALDLMGRREEAKAAYGRVIELGVNDEHQVDTATGYLESPYRED